MILKIVTRLLLDGQDVGAEETSYIDYVDAVSASSLPLGDPPFSVIHVYGDNDNRRFGRPVDSSPPDYDLRLMVTREGDRESLGVMVYDCLGAWLMSDKGDTIDTLQHGFHGARLACPEPS